MTTHQLVLPSGAVIRVCAECTADYPEHQYFCSAVAGYSRTRVLRELVRIDDGIQKLTALCVGPAPARSIERDLGLERYRFWEWAWWIGFDFWADVSREHWRAMRDDLRDEVAEMRARTHRKRVEDAAA